VWRAQRMYRDVRMRDALYCAGFSALAIASHLEMAWFAAWAIFSLAVLKVRTTRQLALTAATALLALALSSPWWATVLWRHGFAPFEAALLGSKSVWPWHVGLLRLVLAPTDEPFLPILAFVAMAGCVICVRRRAIWPSLSTVVIFLTSKRGAVHTATVPLSVAAGFAVVESARVLSRRSGPRVTALVLTCMAAIASTGHIVANQGLLRSVSAEERSLMQSLRSALPAGARVLVLSTDDWSVDRSSEWFPVLADRRSIATPQGTEWLPNGAFPRAVASHGALRACVYLCDVQCLLNWMGDQTDSADYVYVPRHSGTALPSYLPPDTATCAGIDSALQREPFVRLVIDEPGGRVYQLSAEASATHDDAR